jgi:hypothetical protein
VLRRLLLASALPLGVLLPLACGVGTNGLGPAEDTSRDGSDEQEPDVMDVAVAEVVDVFTEASPQYSCNAESCGGACCENQCVPRTCAGCMSGAAFCPYNPNVQSPNGYCTSNCSGCAAAGHAAVTCFSCSLGTPAVSCHSNGSKCPQDLDAGACPCPSGDASQCPGASQVCTQGVCITP